MLNICGVLVQTTPARTDRVAEAIDATEGGQVHARAPGRIVVTVEDTATARASDQIMALNHIPGVISVTLTYHHFEDLEGDEPAEALS